MQGAHAAHAASQLFVIDGGNDSAEERGTDSEEDDEEDDEELDDESGYSDAESSASASSSALEYAAEAAPLFSSDVPAGGSGAPRRPAWTDDSLADMRVTLAGPAARAQDGSFVGTKRLRRLREHEDEKEVGGAEYETRLRRV